VVEPELDVDGLGGLELLLVVLLSLGFLQESRLLLLFGFGLVLRKQLKKLRSYRYYN
jgi:hypothetical protein